MHPDWDLSSRGDGTKYVCAGVGFGLTRAGAGRQTVVRDVLAGTIGRPGLRATNCSAGDPAQPSGKAPAMTLATGWQRPEPGRSPRASIGCILMKRPEEGAFGGPVLAGNPVTDPMIAGVCRSAPSAAVAPPGATRHRPDSEPGATAI